MKKPTPRPVTKEAVRKRKRPPSEPARSAKGSADTPRSVERDPERGYHHGELRAALVTAAIDLIAEHGVPGLSLRECARRAGVSHAAPYRHFADKAALLWAIAEDGFAALGAAGLRAMDGLSDPDARLDAYGAAYVRFAFEHPVQHRVMFTSAIEPPAGRVTPSDDAFVLLERSASLAAPDADPSLAALARWALPHGLSMLILDGRVPPEIVPTADHAERLAREVIAHWRSTRERTPVG